MPREVIVNLRVAGNRLLFAGLWIQVEIVTLPMPEENAAGGCDYFE
jgi:hypothetical protein